LLIPIPAVHLERRIFEKDIISVSERLESFLFLIPFVVQFEKRTVIEVRIVAASPGEKADAIAVRGAAIEGFQTPVAELRQRSRKCAGAGSQCIDRRRASAARPGFLRK